jgi:hypothetical protein
LLNAIIESCLDKPSATPTPNDSVLFAVAHWYLIHQSAVGGENTIGASAFVEFA